MSYSTEAGAEALATRHRPPTRVTILDGAPSWRCWCGQVLLCRPALAAHQLDHEATP